MFVIPARAGGSSVYRLCITRLGKPLSNGIRLSRFIFFFVYMYWFQARTRVCTNFVCWFSLWQTFNAYSFNSVKRKQLHTIINNSDKTNWILSFWKTLKLKFFGKFFVVAQNPNKRIFVNKEPGMSSVGPIQRENRKACVF